MRPKNVHNKEVARRLFPCGNGNIVHYLAEHTPNQTIALHSCKLSISLEMQQLGQTSLISANISKFFVNFDKYSIEETRKYLFPNWCLNFKELHQLFKADLEPNGKACSYEAYLSCFHKLLPIFEGIHHLYCSAKLNLNDLQLKWLGSNYKYLIDLLHLEETTETLSVEKTLLLTSLLENGLANLYFSTNEKRMPPHLLRDLLRSEELHNIFGLEIISLLNILIGTPDSINIRNIVWHGFPKPGEIPEYYSSILVLLTHSLGNELKEKKTYSTERPKVVDFSAFFGKVSNQLLLHSNWFSESDFAELLKNHVWLPHDYKYYWYRISKYYRHQHYWKLVVLITPQIELLLRLIYAQANHFDVRAKLDEYYITMDTIFECDVPSAETNIKNKLLHGRQVNEELLKCLYDLFIAPNGPRLRDKISHGEVDISAIDNLALCDILLYLSKGLLKFESPFQTYESMFHLNCQAKEALCDAIEQLDKLIRIHLAKNTADNLKVMSELKLPTRIKIFNRPRKESEFILLVMRNSKLVQTTCLNYEQSIENRLEMLAQRELHSKRRRTLERMLATMPLICNVLCEILNCLVHIFKQLQIVDDSIFKYEDSMLKLLRFLKHTLKLNENFVKYSDKNSNEWIKAVQLCEKFNDFKMQYYPDQRF